MAIQAIVDSGKIVNTGTSTNKTDVKNGKPEKNAVTEDMFLQLLVAEMKYQDPMEPASNTEWVSQYATFTQVQQQTEMQHSIKQMEANNLVGKQVIMKNVNTATGETKFESGQVDYMYIENGDIYLSVKDKLYNIKDLDTVVDTNYMDAITLATTFGEMVKKLPMKENLSLADEKLITATREAYTSMNSYQKELVKKDQLAVLEDLETRMKELKGTTPIPPTTPTEPTNTIVSGEDTTTMEG